MTGKKRRTRVGVSRKSRGDECKCNSSSDNNGGLIPHELIDQIMLKLPVKSLARFKCVSKHWLSHISSSDFMENYSKACRPVYPILKRFSWKIRDYDFFVFHGPEKYDTVKPLRRSYYLKMVGSANGLVCLVKLPRHSNLVLWKPSTDASIDVIIPWMDLCHSSESGLDCYAFGYDDHDSDHKAARLFFVYELNYLLGAVYSLRTKAWKSAVVDQALFTHRMVEILGWSQTLCGTAHWVARCEGDVRAIVWLRMTDPMVVGQMALPPSLELSRGRLDFTSFQDYKGMLTLFEYENDLTPSSRCWIWVMEHYANSDSWTRLDVTLALGQPFLAIGFLNSSTLLLAIKAKFISYNLHTRLEQFLGDAEIFGGAYMETFALL